MRKRYWCLCCKLKIRSWCVHGSLISIVQMRLAKYDTPYPLCGESLSQVVAWRPSRYYTVLYNHDAESNIRLRWSARVMSYASQPEESKNKLYSDALWLLLLLLFYRLTMSGRITNNSCQLWRWCWCLGYSKLSKDRACTLVYES